VGNDELLRKHLEDCAVCRKIQSTIEALGQSRKTDDKVIAGIDAYDFESAVFQKIRAQESELRHKREDKSYMIRMYFSMGLAAAIVAFMVFSLADLERFVIPSKPASYGRVTTEKKYDTFHIELQPERADAIDESSELAVAEKEVESIDKTTTSAAPPSQEESDLDLKESDVTKFFVKKQKIETPVPEPAPRLLTKIPEEKALPESEKDKHLEMAEAGKLSDIQSAKLKRQINFSASRREGESRINVDMSASQFQILNQPVTKPAPESVIINSIYLSDQSIPLNSQITQAFLPEVIVDSGIIQAVETPRSVLVTVEKMPIPVKIIPPEYPVWARKNGISGTVWVKAHVNEKGDVETAEIASSNNPGYGFEEASLEAAKQCKYFPAEANGYKIGIWVIYPVNFVFKTENSN
jgi:TonB family protein